MQHGAIGRRYARALILAMSSASPQTLSKVETELTSLGELLSLRDAKNGFRQLMLNPLFAAEERLKVLEKIAQNYQFEEITTRLLKLLVEKDRIEQLPAVAHAFQKEADIKLGRVRAIVQTAKALDEAGLQNIVNALKKKTQKEVLPEVVVDDSLIGGVRAQIGGFVYDATVKYQLERLKNNLRSL